MKRILSSLGMIAFVGALVVGGTGAFFSDTETSSANTFTAGAIDLQIDSEQHYNGNVCENVETPEAPVYQWVGDAEYPVPGTACDGSWELTDLESGVHKFFNFYDVKPGDEGENTISIHLDTNPAWMCLDVEVTKNDDVDCNEPELLDDPTCNDPNAGTPGSDDAFDGELAQNLSIFTWLDEGAIAGFQNDDSDPTEGDNVWQDGEVPLFSNGIGQLSDVIGGVTYSLADSLTPNGPIPAGLTQYIGLAWCAGDMTAIAGVITCDGSLMDNAAQTDQTMLDMTFRVEQSRNNDDFTCEEQTQPVVTTLTLAKTVLPALQHPDSAYTLTATGPDVISGIEGAPTVTAAPVTPGVYTLSETDGGFPGATVTWSCIGNATPEVDNLDGTATVTIAPGEAVGCDVTNDYNGTT